MTSSRTSELASEIHLHDNATVGADLPLVGRRAELAVLAGAIEAARRGRGETVLLAGEAGVGRTRLLVEAQYEAERNGVLVLKGRAVESGGADRPLVEAFARPSAPKVTMSTGRRGFQQPFWMCVAVALRQNRSPKLSTTSGIPVHTSPTAHDHFASTRRSWR